MWPGNLRSCCDVATLLCYVTPKYNSMLSSDPECPGRQVRRAAEVAPTDQRSRLGIVRLGKGHRLGAGTGEILRRIAGRVTSETICSAFAPFHSAIIK